MGGDDHYYRNQEVAEVLTTRKRDFLVREEGRCRDHLCTWYVIINLRLY